MLNHYLFLNIANYIYIYIYIYIYVCVILFVISLLVSPAGTENRALS